MTNPSSTSGWMAGRFGRGPLLASLLVFGLFALGMDRPVAPLENPIFCGHWRVRETFDLLLADPREEPTRIAGEFLRQATRAWTEVRQAGKRRPANGTATAEAIPDPAGWLRETLQQREFVPEDVSFYLRTATEFALVVTGTVDPPRWRDLFPPAMVLPRDQGFAVLLPGARPDTRLALHFRPGVIFLTPAEIEGNLADALREGSSRLGERFRTFRAMVQRNPLLAIEADLQAVAATLAEAGGPDLRLSPPLSQVVTFRLLVDQGVVKGQWFTPDDSIRADLADLADSVAAGMREAIASLTPWLPADSATRDALRGFGASLQVSTRGQSVFFEAGSLGPAHPLAGLGALGLLSSLGGQSYERFRRQFPPANARAALPPPPPGQESRTP